jgi:hypothetical protein
MERSYGVVWREGDSDLTTGKLELLPAGVRLEGRESSRQIPYGRVSNVHIGRLPDERIDGRPSIVLEQFGGPAITIATVAQTSLVGEIAERLAALQLDAALPRRVAIVVPLKPGSHDAVRRLVAEGPPFDPAQVDGLEAHQVFVTEKEAIFTFDSSLGEDAFDPVLADPGFWKAAADWREHLAGAPRIADSVYAWARSEDGDELSFLATPGPGDSDGGDIY